MTRKGMDEHRENAGAAEDVRKATGGDAPDSAQDPSLRLARGKRAAGKPALPQLRRAGRRLWSDTVRQQFFDVLAATCNVQEACRIVAMTDTGAYKLRQRDPGFAAAWDEALEQGYAELEMLLLRHSLHGNTRTETVEDGKGELKQVKTVHSYPHDMAVRLWMAHRKTVDAVRAGQGGTQAGSAEVRAEIQVKIAAMRARVEVDTADENRGASA